MNAYLLLAVVCFMINFTSLAPLFLTLAIFFLGLYILGSMQFMGVRMPGRRKLMAATWSPPQEGNIYGTFVFNAEPLVAFLDKLHKEQGVKVSVTTAVTKALALAIKACPGLNCRLVFGKFVPRKSVDIACLVALDDGKDLANALIERADEKTLVEIHQELRARAEKLRAHKDKDFEASKGIINSAPVWLLRPIVHGIGWLAGVLGVSVPSLGIKPYPFGSAMLTSVGMLGVEEAFAPHTPFAHVPLIVLVGAAAKRAVVLDDKLAIQTQLTLTATLDHRWLDGSDAARMAKVLRQAMENPETLMLKALPQEEKKKN